MPYKEPSRQLTATPTMVESPFIIVEIGGVTFGDYSHRGSGMRKTEVKYPNYMKSISIKKVNGTVNTYTIEMEYTITAGDDPNLLEKIFSRASSDRKIIISYGDWSSPVNIYKEEEALITQVQSRVDFAGSKISYTITAVGAASKLTASVQNFPAQTAKPSDILKEIIENPVYGVTSFFPGMRDKPITDFIKGNDKEVYIEAKPATGVMQYMNFLVSCMQDVSGDPGTKYFLYIDDDKKNEYSGPVIKTVEIDEKANLDALDTYEVTIGYPNDDMIMSFNISTNDSWSILYEYSSEVPQTVFDYTIGSGGKIITKTISPLALSPMYKTTASNEQWWNYATSFPISAQLVMKGLTRPSILMTYVKINALFYGRSHIASGTYIITAQEDRIDANGYKTTLTLVRVHGA